MRNWKPKSIPGVQRVGLAVATYLGAGDSRGPETRRRAALSCLVASIQAQTYGDWKLHITHDGPAPKDIATKAMIAWFLTDTRITWHETPERKQQFGHPHRQKAVEALAKAGCVWVGLTNDDNYYAPTWFEWALSAACGARTCDLVYCDLIHSHKLWKMLVTRPKYKHLDLGGLLVKTTLAVKVPFDKFTFAADGDWIDRLAKKARNPQKVDAILFVHN